jgi:bis(5'-nucleosyl)-tetraphosphatase (symmetrical)
VQKIFIGDVQGCGDELELLLDRGAREFGDAFVLWCVGDLINRGPANLLALERMRRLSDAGRGHYVLGNHEIGLLRVWLGLRELAPQDTFGDVLEDDSRAGWIDWICQRPVAIRGSVGGSDFAMVHASVHPEWSLDELEDRAQRVADRLASGDSNELRALLGSEPSRDRALIEDRDALGRLTRCRSLTSDLAWSSELPGEDSRPWHVEWSLRRHDYGVVYGHWALQGLHVAPGLRGLDSGCVHHGRGRDGYLTGWLPDESHAAGSPANFALPDDRFWQVRALRQYYT